MSNAENALRRKHPSFAQESHVGGMSGRWIGTQDNTAKNQMGSIVLTTEAAYVYKKGSIFNPEEVERIPMGQAKFQVKPNPRDAKTAVMYLDVVDAKHQEPWAKGVESDDFARIQSARTAGHRLLILGREGYELSRLLQRAIRLWQDDHQWREAGFDSRLAMDRAINEAGSAIGLFPDEVDRVGHWIKEDGLPLQEAQGRILDERAAASDERKKATPVTVSHQTKPVTTPTNPSDLKPRPNAADRISVARPAPNAGPTAASLDRTEAPAVAKRTPASIAGEREVPEPNWDNIGVYLVDSEQRLDACKGWTVLGVSVMTSNRSQERASSRCRSRD